MQLLTDSASGANILDSSVADDVYELISNYFVRSDLDDDEDEPPESAETGRPGGEKFTSGSDSDDESTIAFVDASQKEIACDIHDSPTKLNVDTELQRVKEFDCRCKIMVKSAERTAVGARGGDADTSEENMQGCISQFSSESVLKMRMNMAEFTEG